MDELKKAACEYFFLISRIEYALKNSDYLDVNDGDVKPSWTKFIDEIGNRITLSTENKYIRYLADDPPKKQTYKDGNLSWSSPQAINQTNVKGLICACLTIRNNLFHGGKINDNDQERNLNLLKAATEIFNAAMNASPKKTKKAFEEARL
ncbi:MAG: hypothetical protein KC643_23170 [Nitrospira sp.]|nr:hypothetical protein [Nitrospira sp.]